MYWVVNRMNPHSLQSNSHTWLVLLVIYNLSPHLCMKRKNLILTMLILGLRQLGNDIDIYLAPLIEDQKLLWEEAIDCFYASWKKLLLCKLSLLQKSLSIESLWQRFENLHLDHAGILYIFRWQFEPPL